jgi:hypothetical protein
LSEIAFVIEKIEPCLANFTSFICQRKDLCGELMFFLEKLSYFCAPPDDESKPNEKRLCSNEQSLFFVHRVEIRFSEFPV